MGNLREKRKTNQAGKMELPDPRYQGGSHPIPGKSQYRCRRSPGCCCCSSPSDWETPRSSTGWGRRWRRSCLLREKQLRRGGGDQAKTISLWLCLIRAYYLSLYPAVILSFSEIRIKEGVKIMEFSIQMDKVFYSNYFV